ncbi:sulfatase [Pontibacter arcticus]|uniref:Sulfatase n=2 Tax=Pontibacter arcticus TaxID=2080288 RepID=A0A364RG47_9BACT|nr:sulfatase [Pontibacter arcticus]
MSARAIFLGYHLDKTQKLTASEILNTFLYGLRLDISFTSYICALPFIAVLLSAIWPRIKSVKFVWGFTCIWLVIISTLLAIDLELYTFWGYRLDATPLQYLNTPGEIAASAAAAPFLLLVFVIVILSGAFILLYQLGFDLAKFNVFQQKWVMVLLSFVYLIVLILPMRGGWQQIPINQSVVYFSNTPYANHAGLNMPWNLMHALLKYGKESSNPYQFMPAEEAEQKVAELHAAPETDTTASLLNTQKPNVLFIILESYTAKFVGSLGGEKGVTPNLDKLAAEGISFTKLYASGDRSEKGMVSLLSGYPVQTITSIIKTPKKTERLPQLSKVFKEQGYATSFFYGGELEFANIKSFLRNGSYEKLIDKADFPSESYNSKWGAHDHVLFERVLKDLNQEKKPFFSTVYTLSSHEPYEIPIPAKFPGTTNEAKFRNSVYYTDYALGNFIAEAKKQAWWQNTLVVLVADHGHPLPGEDANHERSKFHIPFILTGGAVAQKGLKIDALGSQTDIAPTLLAQLGLPYQDFKWGRNLLAPTAYPFAFYVFNDGFGFLTPQGSFLFDNVAKRPIAEEGTVTEAQRTYGKAYMQYSFEDFLKK